MEVKFTPGPWKYMPFPDGDHSTGLWQVGIFNPRSLIIGVRDEEYMKLSGICTEADARLIATAPDLLEALIEMVSDFDGCYAEAEPAMMKARAAIKKATGDQS
ncbi:hypothetical protein [Advenella sp. EE-W14]|uniref:hypothetical protein n=1 Tax=Advenella sp. EE-W14 TaxID=2722705 RepID=UPI00145CD494|nr:hypothetical protein [Advenella sp. EE-W14]